MLLRRTYAGRSLDLEISALSDGNSRKLVYSCAKSVTLVSVEESSPFRIYRQQLHDLRSWSQYSKH